MTTRLILASTSPFRRALMMNAGLAFEWEDSGVDERAIEDAEGRWDPVTLAATLAKAKAVAVSLRNPSALVIGSDQVLSLQGQLLHKSKSIADAREVLLRLRGQTHELNSAVAVAVDGQIVWEHVDIARMSVREFTEEFLSYYVESVDEKVLRSVGGYQLEGVGVQLFDRIDGDYFTVLGLPLVPLLDFLRRVGAAHA
ncbi:Maf family nucleotide pyrophosphatase [Ciceribacter sp. L1K22]|uniref:Maf family nucleotide pyrophosphatase n=1 Tax=Ciceribacter sp. L1K22 TaxID=2820275 RepID=UPI001ABE4838|nr:Maf family nucleotide pyrophosphatase [Ciceribacter sp. L1K22]MBO3758273.1 septum formation protein Maf [Ciceribacter sp. L1K22]